MTDLTDADYRRFPAFSNSSLGELLAKVMNRPKIKAKPETLQFGTTLHQFALEPNRPIDWAIHDDKERYAMMQMRDSLQKFMAETMPGVIFRHIEIPIFWTDSDTGLPCKAKIDVKLANWKNRNWIIDLKTTSEKSSEAFFDCFEDYGYDRQAAFYADGNDTDYLEEYLVGNNVLFIAVQKCKPYNVFSIDLSIRPQVIEQGRKKYKRLLRLAAEEMKKPYGWRPSEWNRAYVG